MVGGLLLSVVTGCAVPRAGTAPPPPRPPVATRESLRINVVYPAATDILQSHDSAFVFGSVRGGSGPLRLTLEGRPVPVRGNGAWLAWLGLPDDTLTQLRLVAHAGVDSAATLVVARIAPRFHPPPGHAAWIDTTSFTPTGSLLLPAGEGIVLSVRATPGASVQLALPGGAMIPLVPDTLPAERAWGLQAFAIDSAGYSLPPDAARYAGWLPAAPLCTDGRTGCATLDVAVAGDTTSARWPLTVALADMTLPTVVRLNHDTAHTGTTDSLTAGRAVPLVSAARAAILRVPLPARLPFQVTEHERSLTLRLYGAASDINWMQYGGTDPLVTRMSYAQPTRDELTITLELSRRVWGYRARFDGRDLLLEVRRPPTIDRGRPLAHRTVVLDPGHPPLGATGPTGLWEPVATLAVALKAKRLLERAGATVLLTRSDTAPVDLYARTQFAEQHDADVLVSIHANALPDGVNPFTNSGTSVYYFHPRSVSLARELDRALVAEFGVRNLGIGRGDYALVRPTWMPAALTEGLFMMVPEQEEMLAGEDGQWRYARGVTRGIEAFLRARAREP